MSNLSSTLLTPLRVGAFDLEHRAAMAPLTRSRSRQPGDVPWELNAEYYRQRANPHTGASLIISEATQISPQGKGYAFTPGIHSDEQVAGWRLVTGAVHREGGRIVCQLWHVGRISHADLQPGGAPPVAPSALRADSMTFTSATSGRVQVSMPRALETDEIPAIVEDYATAARNALSAGFDGVEIHGANGYLIDQFTRDGTNRRIDAYGGPVENRLRFAIEVADAVIGVCGPGRVGYRMSPTRESGDLKDSDAAGTFARLAGELGHRGIAYLHLVERFTPEEERAEPVLDAVRAAFKAGHPLGAGAAYMGSGGLDPFTAGQRIAEGRADLVAFGKLFISNPDLIGRARSGAPLSPWDAATFYGGDARGYTDYPSVQGGAAAV